MAKNIVICCDGTANEFASNNTNVVKLYYTLLQGDAQQVTYYHPGLGTMEPPGALTGVARRITKLLGRAVGYGLSADVRDAYAFIMSNFEADDRIFLFGFSRGAYTVRAVASMLHMFGVIHRGNEPLVPYAIRMMTAVSNRRRKGDAEDTASTDAGAIFELAARFKSTFSSVPCRVHFVGVWDTVSSVGWLANPLTIPYSANNPSIDVARHAIAIDERRAFFRTNLWKPADKPPSGPRDLKQVWFPGVHCDVGGGYSEAESGLAKIALEWMLAEAHANGLLLDLARVERVLGRKGRGYVAPDPMGRMHNSLTLPWWPAELVPKKSYDWRTGTQGRRMNLFRGRTLPPDAMIHEAAYQRGAAYVARLPAGAARVSTRKELAAPQDASQPSSST